MTEEYIAFKDAAEQPGTFFDLVANTSTEIAPTRPNRFQIDVVNDSEATIYLRLGSNAVVNSGIRLNPNGGSWSSTSWAGRVHAIHNSTGLKRVVVAEV